MINKPKHLIFPPYPFQEIDELKKIFLKNNPQLQPIDLSIGDTPLPLTYSIEKGIQIECKKQLDPQTTSGYESAFGRDSLREKIQKKWYPMLTKDEIFISDGAKCDLFRIQKLFDLPVAIQDPSYPAYLSSSILTSKEITLLPCTPKNDYFFDLSLIDKPSLIIICSPNNPTGKTFSVKELKHLISFAIQNDCILYFDRAYSDFIQDHSPQSIFEIPEAKKCAIESFSFSKGYGFTGIRLAGTALSHELCYSDGSQILDSWKKILSCSFNGASCFAQAAAETALDHEEEKKQNVSIYLNNSQLLKKHLPFPTIGGENIPYLWAKVKDDRKAFEAFLNCGIITTFGSAFGPHGKNHLRLSGFATPYDLDKALVQIEKNRALLSLIA